MTHPSACIAHLYLLSVGYDDPSYFTRRFRAAIGITPTAYARETGVAGWERMLK
jgi:AraC-like DNA-binding protein